MNWEILNFNSAVWHLTNTPYCVWAPQDAKTFVVQRINIMGNRVAVKRGFRKLASAKAYAEQRAKYEHVELVEDNDKANPVFLALADLIEETFR